MSRKFLSLLLGLVLLALPAMAQASVEGVFDTSGSLLNRVKFTNYEVFMNYDDETQAWTAVDTIDGQEIGDVLVSIYSAEAVSVQLTANEGGYGSPTWQQGNGNGYMLGYSAQRLAGYGTNGEFIYTTAQTDPFGFLQPGEMVALRTSTTDWTLSGTVATDVASVFAATTSPWATFGMVAGGNNLAEFSPFPFPPLGILGIAKFALDVLDNQSGLDFVASPATANSDITGGAIIYAPGFGEWIARSEDPLLFAAVPEPATLAMWGSFLAIGAVVALRRRRK